MFAKAAQQRGEKRIWDCNYPHIIMWSIVLYLDSDWTSKQEKAAHLNTSTTPCSGNTEKKKKDLSPRLALCSLSICYYMCKAIHERPCLKPLSTTSGYFEHWILKPRLHFSFFATHEWQTTTGQRIPWTVVTLRHVLISKHKPCCCYCCCMCCCMISCNSQRRSPKSAICPASVPL